MENSKLKNSNSELTTLIDQLEDEYASLHDMYAVLASEFDDYYWYTD